MSTHEALFLAIKGHWEASWLEGAEPTSPTAYEGVAFEPPKDNEGRGLPWARLSILMGNGRQMSSGSPGGNVQRRPGVIQIELHVVEGEGQRELTRLMDLACQVFNYKSIGTGFSRIVCRDASARILPSDGAWQRALMRCDFWQDRLATVST